MAEHPAAPPPRTAGSDSDHGVSRDDPRPPGRVWRVEDPAPPAPPVDEDRGYMAFLRRLVHLFSLDPRSGGR